MTERCEHGLDDGTVIAILEVLGASGISSGDNCHLINANGNNFQVALTPGGEPIDLVGNGTCKYVVVT